MYIHYIKFDTLHALCFQVYNVVFLQVVYAAALLGMSLYGLDNLPSYKLVAYFAMVHVVVWATVGVFDR